MHVKDTLQNLLRVLLRDRYPFKGEAEISRMLEQIQLVSPATLLGRSGPDSSKGLTTSQLSNFLVKEHGVQSGVIEEWMWRRIIEKMYDYVDAVELEDRFLKQISLRDQAMNQYIGGLSENQLMHFISQNKITVNANRKVSREEILNFVRKHQGKLLYMDFQKIILDFQLQEHEKFLKNFTSLFKRIDQFRIGYLNEAQFRDLMSMMGLISQDDEIAYLLSQIDPYKNNRMTYSEVVQLLSSHMVPNTNATTG